MLRCIHGKETTLDGNVQGWITVMVRTDEKDYKSSMRTRLSSSIEQLHSFSCYTELASHAFRVSDPELATPRSRERGREKKKVQSRQSWQN